MKKPLFFLLPILFICSTIFSKPYAQLTTVFDQVDYLMALHQKAWAKQSFANGFVGDFFAKTGFIKEGGAANFFRQVQHSISSGQLSPTEGYRMVSYSSVISINGSTTAVSYSFAQKGKDIHFAKQAYVNGQKLKAVYHYDTSGKLLKIKEYQDQKLIHQGMLEI